MDENEAEDGMVKFSHFQPAQSLAAQGDSDLTYIARARQDGIGIAPAMAGKSK